MPEPTGEVFRVLFLDGIWLDRDLVVLIAYDGEHAVSWYMAETETSRAWEALMAPIPAPGVVVCGRRHGVRVGRPPGMAAHEGPEVPLPRVRAGEEVHDDEAEAPGGQGALRARARADAPRDPPPGGLVGRALPAAVRVLGRLPRGRERGGRPAPVHPREAQEGPLLALAGSSRGGALFTYLDPALTAGRPLPRTNNAIEGGVNAQLRDVLRNHRGLSLMRRAKAVFWWCYMHTEGPRPARELLRSMPTDADIDPTLQDLLGRPQARGRRTGVGRQGVWEELHHRDPYPSGWTDSTLFVL